MNQLFEEARGALWSIWHRRWLALAVAWGVCVLGWLIVALIPNSYEAKARIYVDMDDVLSEQIGIAGDGRAEITRVRQTLASAINLEKVIRSTRLGETIANQREMEAEIAALAKKVTVKSEEDNLFELSATVGRSDLSDSENAALAQDVTQKLIDVFREENIAGNRSEVAGTIQFLDQQLEARKRELEAAEQRRLAFEAQYPDLVGGPTSLTGRITTLRTEMRGIEADIAAAESALAAINGQLAGTPRTIMVAGEAGGARGALMQAQGQLAQLRSRGLTDSHPDIQSTRRQIDLLRQQAASEGAYSAGGSPNPAYSSLVSIKAERQANLNALQARRAAVQSDLTSMMASQADEPAVAAEANRISRDYEVLKTKYDELLKDREEIQLRGDVETERSAFQFTVVDPPVIPRNPAAPNRPLLLIGVLFAGLVAGAGAAFAMGQMRSTFTTSDKLERALDLPVIGTISLTVSEAKKAIEARRLRQFFAASGALAGIFAILLAIEFVQVGMLA